MSESKCIQLSNNTYFYYEYFNDFLKKNPQIPLCNRDYIEERVNEFKTFIIFFFLNFKIK